MAPEYAMTFADECLERASKATNGPWDTLCEHGEVHAITFIDSGGDPFHIVENLKRHDDAEFIAHSRTDVVELANRLKRAIHELKLIAQHAELLKIPVYYSFIDELEKPLEKK